MKILVADDCQDTLESLVELLRLHGHEVHSARNGQDALLIACSLQPHAAVIDIGMPGLDGFQVAAALRSMSKEVVLLASTGWPKSAFSGKQLLSSIIT